MLIIIITINGKKLRMVLDYPANKVPAELRELKDMHLQGITELCKERGWSCAIHPYGWVEREVKNDTNVQDGNDGGVRAVQHDSKLCKGNARGNRAEGCLCPVS